MSQTDSGIGERAGAGATGVAGPARVAVVGMSVGRICGVRDHATVLAAELEREHVACSFHWLSRANGSMRADLAEIRAWAQELGAELARSSPDVVILHYSVFDYSYRGLPLFVRPAMAAVRRSRVPSIVVLHELAYPWRRGGWRGDLWALSQRVVLVDVMRTSSAALVTADFRAEWLATRRWLPRRPVALAPVFSNLPAPSGARQRVRASNVVGLFGFSYEGVAIAPILDALADLRGEGLPVSLRLLGSPGRPSPSATAWLQAAQARGLGELLSFSGALPAQALSDELAACDVLLFADVGGPSSRKGSLAASLASGRPVVALDGPRTWPALVESDAARVVPPIHRALADALRPLLLDERAREEQGARGRVFAEQRMGVAVSARAVSELYDAISTRRAPS
jgi:glycosyltransferase involved in cell wall biosynthesis